MTEVVLLLTSTVNVKGMSFTALTDKLIRENHYLDAISYYFFETNVKIVVTENTGHSFLSKLSQPMVDSGRLELLCFNGNNFPKEKGKGYGELESISYAMRHSQMIGENTAIIKITGRYKVRNIRTFINSANRKSSDLCQFLYFKGHSKAFSGIFIADKNFFFSFLEHNHDLMNDSKGVYFEHVLATSLLEFMRTGGNFLLIGSFPRLIGVSGTENLQHRTNKFSFWFFRNIIYKIVRFNFVMLDKTILRIFQG